MKLSEKYVLSLPALIYLGIFFVLPIIIMVSISFMLSGDFGGVKPLFNYESHQLHTNLTLNNYKYVFHTYFIWQLILRTIFYSLLTTVFCLILGYPIALLISRSGDKLKNILLLLIIIPFWSCFLIRVYAWMIILGPNDAINKLVNLVRDYFGLAHINLLYTSFSVILCMVYINLPFMILPLYANLEKHNIDLLEAGQDLGASSLKIFLNITLPLSLPGILIGSVLVFIPSMGMFVIPELFGSNCTYMIGNLIKQQFLQTMNWPLGSVTAIIMTFIVVIISLFGNYLSEYLKETENVED